MSIGQFLMILWRRGWITVLTFLTALAVAFGVLLVVPGRYEAVATATVDPAGNPITGSGGDRTQIGLAQGNMLQVIQSQEVAVDVVKRLNLTANPAVQQSFRQSGSFGRESIDEWMASSIIRNVAPNFLFGSSILSIKYKSGDPNQAATIANAYLAATIDATIAMKVESAEKTAHWFDPQIDAARKEFQAARDAYEAFQAKANLTGNVDTTASALMAINNQLSGARAEVTALQSRLSSENTNINADPGDPDLQTLNELKTRASALQTELDVGKTSYGANNPKIVMGQASLNGLRKQIADATEKMHQHLLQRIAFVQTHIASLETAQAEAQRGSIADQAQRDRLGELQHDAGFRLGQLNQQQSEAALSRLQSKLTFADIAVLDKAVPPTEPAFPKPAIVIPVAIGAGLTLGLILALIAEMLDRRIRFPADLEFATSRPMLGRVMATRRVRLGGGARQLSPAA